MNQINKPERKAIFVMEQVGKIKDMDKSFDIEFWQMQDATARFDAVGELVLFHHLRKEGTDGNELRLQRTIEDLQRKPG